MALVYDNLWNLIEKRGLSKTDFRKLVGISTVSLAKLSKNEPVTLNIIEQICQVLKCEISEVVSVVSKIENKKWSRIKEDKFYLINLYYLVENDAEQNITIKYLYGFSTAYGVEIEERKSWRLTEELKQGSMAVWKIAHVVKGDVLLDMINSIDQDLSFGLLLQNCGHELRDEERSGVGKKIKEILLSKTIIPRTYLYRNPFFLTAEQESTDIRNGVQPFHSFDKESMLCEALISQEKRELYCDEEGCLDSLKMQIIHDLFVNEKFAINGFRDISRIGDFELFYPLTDVGDGELFEIETIKNTTNDRKIELLGYKVIVHAAELEGQYALEVIVSGSMGPVVYKMFNLTLQGKDVVKEIVLEESAGTIEVRLFDMNLDSEFQLIAWKKTSIMMEAHIQMNMLSQKTTLVSQKRKNKNVSEKYVIEQYSRDEFKVGGDNKHSWDKGYLDVYDDFCKLYGENKAETYLFPANDEQKSFLEWLKKKIDRNYNEIWLFDPYIDEKVMPKLLSLVKNCETILHVVTCFRENQKEKDGERIEKIKLFCREASKIMGTMEIVALKNNNGRFHDRVIMLVGNGFYPEVYSMSNSLDSMGENFSSIVAKLDSLVGAKVSEEYLNKYFGAVEEDKIEILREKVSHASENSREDITVDIEALLKENGIEGVFEEAKRQLKLYETQKQEKKFLTVILPNEFRTCLEQMKCNYVYYCGEELRKLPFMIQQILRTLFEQSYDKYMELLKLYSTDTMGMSALQIHYALRELLIEKLQFASRDKVVGLACKYMKSDVMEIVALGAVCLMEMDEMEILSMELVDKKNYLEECYREKVIDMQIEDCRKHYRINEKQNSEAEEKVPVSDEAMEFCNRLQDTKIAWVNLMDENLSDDDLKYKFQNLASRSVQDVCDLTMLLVDGGKITSENGGSYLRKCLFEKIEREYKKEDGFWRGQDFLNASIYIKTIEHCTGEKIREQVLREFVVWEKRLVRILQDVFLEKKNYRKWKTCIDSLLWCMTMRGFCRDSWIDYNALNKDTNLFSREKEMKGIVRKSEYTLEKYSEAYQIWKQNSCGFTE